jgi:hypothetical protein
MSDDDFVSPEEPRIAKHLPMKRSELPPPLDRMEIDTSRNPGRYIVRKSYIEAVGAIMWFGEPFWERTGASKADVLAAEWLQVSEPYPGVLRVQAADRPFSSPDGEIGEAQARLRSLLFPTAPGD